MVAAGEMSVAGAAEHSVSQSDNAAANLLLARLGGPAVYTQRLRAWGDMVTRLDRNELGLNEKRKENADNENAVEKKAKALVFDAIIGGVKGLTDDGKELSVKLFADAKTDDLSAEVTLTAKSGSATAKNFTAIGSKTSIPAGIVAAAGAPVARGNVKVALTDGMKKEYGALIDAMFAGSISAIT